MTVGQVGELQLTENVVFVMRSADWDAEVLRRGARILGQAMEQPENIPAVCYDAEQYLAIAFPMFVWLFVISWPLYCILVSPLTMLMM